MIYDNVSQLIGKTPLVRVKQEGYYADILLKLEYFNPGGSIKDRIAKNMIEYAEKENLINGETTIIEPTSGNTGVGLALVCAAKGYKLILTMPETMSVERRKLLKAYGAKLYLTPGTQGMQGAIQKAKDLNIEIENSIVLQQFANKANPDIHRKTTVNEIIEATNGEIDYLVAGVGTGGTITGIGEVLKDVNKAIKVIAVEPSDSPVLSGGEPGSHKLQGIGAGFVPEILNTEVIDEIAKIQDDEAYRASRKLARVHGILVGISSGAAFAAGEKLALDPNNEGKRIVVILPDNGERYLSTQLFDEV